MKTTADRADTHPKSATETPVSAIRGMCPGINADVTNDVEDTHVADQLITAKAAARLESLEIARKITLDDL